MSIMTLWNLNSDVLIPIITDWLSFEVLGVLDAAVVHRRSRLRYLRLLRMKECVIGSSVLFLDSCFDSTLSWILRRGLKFKKMSFTCDGTKIGTFIDVLQAQEDSLEDLELIGLDPELIDIMPELLKSCSRLQALQLFQSTTLSDLACIINSVPVKERLLKITLSGLAELTSDAIKLVGESFPNVQYFEMYDSNSTTSLTGVQSSQCFKKLHQVMINHCQNLHSDVAGYLLRNASQLRKLETTASSVVCAAAQTCTVLQELHVTYCEAPVTASLQLLFQNNRNTLREVYLIENSIDDAGLSALSCCRGLTSLSLDKYEDDAPPLYTSSGLAAALSNLQQLTYLAVELTSDEGGAVVSESFRYLTSLRRLYLHGTYAGEAAASASEGRVVGLTNGNAVSLVSSCSSLQILSLGPHGRLLEDSFILAVAENLSDLHFLTLEAPMLTDGSVMQMVSKCRRLAVLDLTTSSLLTHKTLLHIVAQAEALADLTLCVDNLTATSVQSLVNAQPALSQIHFRTTSDISRPKYKTFKQTIKLVKEMRPQLVISGVFSDVHCM